MLMRDMILPEFDEEMANTRKLLERLPDQDLDYAPHRKSMPLNRLAGHVVELPSWAKMTMDVEVLKLEPCEFEPSVVSSREQALRDFDANVAGARAALSSASDEDLAKTWTMIWAGKTILSAPRYRVLQASVLNHLVHHRAQLGVYLRLKDVALPGMYGPSADEMQQWTAEAKASA